MKIYALIPIKHNSERVPRKNYRDFNGKPLFYWILNTLLNSTYIDKIIIDTDSPTIKKLIPKYFQNYMGRIIIYNRPTHLLGGHVATNDLFINVINTLNLDADFYFQTHTTNPLLKTSTINNAIETFLKEKDYESLFSVKTHYTRLYDSSGNDMNHNRFKLIPTQELDPIYEENSCIYLFSKESLLKYNARIGKKAYLYKMSDIESTDIDWEDDFKIAEILHKYINKTIKYLLITGANGDIGTEICKYFNDRGWFVIGTDIHDESTNTYINQYIKGDLTNVEDIKNIIKNNTRIDCLIHCAAYQCCKAVWEYSIEEWDNTFSCNIKSVFLLVKYGIEILKKYQTNIINISSIHSLQTSKNISAYASSKAALTGFTRNLALDLSKFNIRVNSISPGAIDTKMLRSHLNAERLDFLKKNHLLGKIGNCVDIANACYFICHNKFMNGSNLIIDGGVSVKLGSE